MAGNKVRGVEVEDFVKEKLGLQDSENSECDALDNGVQVEIKSSELLHENNYKIGFVKTRFGRFSIQPDAHSRLKKDSKYIFVVLLKGHPLFLAKLSWNIVNERIKRYSNPTLKYKILISEIIDEAEKIPNALMFLNGKAIE